ncbi:hypothetical protein CgunFtcFv8_000127 [Champsocephalus gunnari]|nr:hypothetical protein CgunFtcFv8_000127 [Champsocephalus gunnari]
MTSDLCPVTPHPPSPTHTLEALGVQLSEHICIAFAEENVDHATHTHRATLNLDLLPSPRRPPRPTEELRHYSPEVGGWPLFSEELDIHLFLVQDLSLKKSVEHSCSVNTTHRGGDFSDLLPQIRTSTAVEEQH